MYSSYADLASDQSVLRVTRSLMWNYWNIGNMESPGRVKAWAANCGPYYEGGGTANARATAPNGKPLGVGATGGAWAYRMEAFNALGRLLDRCILGSADWYMAFGLLGSDNPGPETRNCTKAYREYILDWAENAKRLKANVGYVDAHLAHLWHGPKSKRQYGDRWRILETNRYDPYTDIQTNVAGVYEFRGNKPRLRDEVRRYFRDRMEDHPGN
jgi:hypothetical protein